MNNDLIVPYHAPLSPLDTESQTYGCRQVDPKICSNNLLPEVCAFVTKDKVCKRPSRKWKKQFNTLLQNTGGGSPRNA
jgi:hypothetical protein